MLKKELAALVANRERIERDAADEAAADVAEIERRVRKLARDHRLDQIPQLVAAHGRMRHEEPCGEHQDSERGEHDGAHERHQSAAGHLEIGTDRQRERKMPQESGRQRGAERARTRGDVLLELPCVTNTGTAASPGAVTQINGALFVAVFTGDAK